MEANKKIAIDCGNVICLSDTDQAGGSLKDKIMSSKITDECFDAVKKIVYHFGVDNTFVLSKCKDNVMCASIVFLTRNDFFNKTGLNPRNVIFCKNRSGGECDGFKKVKNVLDLSNDDEKYFNNTGPRVSTSECGKGACAKKLGLNILIDDRVDCLKSFNEEGADGDKTLIHFIQKQKPEKKWINLTTNVWSEVTDFLFKNTVSINQTVPENEPE